VEAEMNSRMALSVLLIVIGVMVVTSQRSGLLEKSRILEASWTAKISEAHSLLVLYSCTTGNQPVAARTAAPEVKAIRLDFSDATRCLGSHTRHLQHMVLSLIDSDR
jgi:hypothetical protein